MSNCGLLDQLAALGCVRDNLAAMILDESCPLADDPLGSIAEAVAAGERSAGDRGGLSGSQAAAQHPGAQPGARISRTSGSKCSSGSLR